MDRVLFLSSKGGIISRYPHLRSEEPLPVAPYVENVMLPVVSVDSSALYGDHPENLARLTYSGGAALTFFCDSVAGGGDSSGDGSFDNPWRSLNMASRFLSYESCILHAAAAYIQLKIKGTVDYISSNWKPWDVAARGKLILTGWDGKCDLGTAEFYAGYFFNLRTKVGSSAAIACSGCTLFQPGAAKALAVDCEIESGGYVSCAYNCSGSEIQSRGTRNFYASVCHGGSWGMVLSADHAYSPVVSVSGAREMSCGLAVRGAAVGASVTVTGSGSANGIIGLYGNRYLGGCIVNVTATADNSTTDSPNAVASACAFRYDVSVVSGGSWTAVAAAAGWGNARSPDRAEAEAYVSGFGSGITLNNVSVTLTADATAHLMTFSGSQEENEYERICNAGSSSWIRRVRIYSGGIMVSGYTNSGGR